MHDPRPSLEPDEPRADAFPLRGLMLSVYAPALLLAVGQGAVLLALPLFAAELGGSLGVAGTVFAMRGLGTFLSDVPAGVAVSRFGDRPVMIGSVIALGAVGGVAGLSTSAFALGACTLVYGAGWGTWLLSRLHYLTEALPSHQRGRALVVMAGLQRIGMFVGPIVGGGVAGWFGLGAAFWLLAVLAPLALVLILLHMPSSVLTREIETERAHLRVGRTLVEHRQTFARAGGAVILLQIVRAARQFTIPLWGEAIGLDPQQIGLVAGLSAAIDAAMFYPAGIILDRFGRKWTGVPCIALLSLSLALLPFAGDFGALLAVALLAGFGNGLGAGIVMTLGADLSPASRRGEFLGVWRLFGDLGHLSGPLLLGALAEAVALGSASVVAAGLGACGALLMAFAVPETLARPPSAPGPRARETDREPRTSSGSG